MMKIIYRGLVLALTVIMLLSVTCPVAALAEMGVSDNSDTTETTESSETAVETKPIVEEPSTGKEKIIQEENPSGAGLEEIIEVDNNLEPVPEAKAEESVEQEIIKTELPAGLGETNANSLDNSSTQQKEENTAAGIQAAGAAAKAASSISTGSLSAADGSTKNTRTKTNAEMFIDAKGSDETGNGSFEAPFATLAAALSAAREMGVDAELCLLSNLSVTSTVQILGMNVYLTSNEGACTITRDDAFDLGEGGLNSAMFAIGSPAEDSPGGQLILEHVVLNEKGMKTEPVQDGMISVYSGGKLILGEETMLLNYGGESAVYAGAGSEVSVSATGWILNDMPFEEDGTVAIREEEGSTVIREAGCIVLSHGEVWNSEKTDAPAETGANGKTENSIMKEGIKLTTDDAETPDKNENEDDPITDEKAEDKATSGQEKSQSGTIQKRSLLAANSALNAASSLSESSISFRLEAPESVSSSDAVKTVPSYVANDVAGYEIPYTLSVNLGSIIGSSGTIAGGVFEKATVKMTVTLDDLLYPVTSATGSVTVALSPEFSVFEVKSAAYQATDHKIAVELATDDAGSWKEHTAELEQTLVMTFKTVVPSGPTSHSEEHYPQKDKVSSSVIVNQVSVILGNETRSFNPTVVSSGADTKLLGARKATLVYDPNGGNGGTVTQSLPEETGHKLETSEVPTHENVNGMPVLFYGWTLEKDHKIYIDGESKPETVATVNLTENQTVTVYAVYSFDRNEDGIPDVDQRILTLGFDANGGAGNPSPIIKSATGGLAATFDIPPQEPTRKYYTFLGWSEDENATEAKYKYDAPKKANRDITITKDTCLYAVWEENPVYTLYFNGNGGSNVPAAQSARSDNGVAEMTITRQIPTRSGRTFVGWSVQRYGTAAFDPGEDVRLTGGDVTLFAVWERNGSSSGRAPKTGDESNVPLYVVLAVGSAAAAYAVVQVLKKRRK